MHERIRDLALRSLGRQVTTHAWPTLAVALLLAVGCVLLTASRLEFQTDRSDLVDPEIGWNRQYAEYRARFPRWDDLIVCLEGAPDDGRIDDLARRLADSLRTLSWVAAADAGATFGPEQAALFRVAEPAAFDATLEQLAAARAVTAAENANQALAAATAGLQARRAEADAAALERLADLLGPYLAALRGDPPDFGPLLGSATTVRREPFASPSGRIRFVLVHLDSAETGRTVSGLGERLRRVRELTGRLVAAAAVPGVTWGVTGVPAIEADETTQSIRDSTVASIAAMVLITLLMVAVFRGFMVPLLAAGTLLVGMAWSFGWLVLTVGHLQLLSVVFTVILLGLGIDFALHLVARLELVQDEHRDLPSAIARVFGGIGPGLLTGALTTAGAFGVVALTDFKGMAEMGVIAAGGIMLCLLATMTVFPAGLAVTRRWKSIIRHRRGGETAHFARGILDGVDGHPVRALSVSIALAAVLGVAAFKVHYDPNVLNLHPPGIESVRWERRIMDDGTLSVWAGLYTAAPEEAGPLVDRLRAVEDHVGEVGGIGEFLPPDRAERQARIDAVRNRTVTLPPAPPGFDALRGQVAAIRLGLSREADRLDRPPPALAELLAEVRAALAASTAVPDTTGEARWSALQSAFVSARDRLRPVLDTALRPGWITAADLPPAARAQNVGTDGTWLIRVFPRQDDQQRSVLHPDRLGPFVAALRSVDAGVLGPPVQIYESSRLIIREYVKAAVLALGVILVLLILDFRSLPDALCALLPVTIGFVGAFGIMGITGVPLNFANIIVMPIIFGIGVDAGVHIVHRWRAEPHGCPAGLSGGTGRGVTLTMIATIIGFACMLLAEHRGIRSLGLLMVAGLTVTLVACYTTLPALLHLRPAGAGTPPPGSPERVSDAEGHEAPAGRTPEPSPEKTVGAARRFG